MVSIKICSAEDAPIIADLSRQTFYETFAPVNTKENMDKFMNEQFTREKLVAEVSEPGNIFLLAYDDDTPAGYAKLKEGEKLAELDNRPSIELVRIYAASSAIGKGVGSALMKECMAIAARLGKEILWLGVWENNQRAIDFYTRWGFEKFSTHIFLLGDDEQTDWLMKKELQPEDQVDNSAN